MWNEWARIIFETRLQVKLEIVAQIAKFKEMTGDLPIYVDGHQHVHVLPGQLSIESYFLLMMDLLHYQNRKVAVYYNVDIP